MDPQPSVKKSMAPIDSYSQGRTTELNYEPFKESWWPDNTTPAKDSTPLFLEEKQELFGFESVYDECNQAVALEEDVWDLTIVSG